MEIDKRAVRPVKTRKGAAAFYIVIFTTTLLGVVTLSFVRIMLAEAARTNNYSLSQSAYNSALAGIEDAKIVLLRYQNCIETGSYADATGSNKDCTKYKKLFEKATADPDDTSRPTLDCDKVGELLHGNMSKTETLIQTNKSNSGTVDQAYTCVRVSIYTDDFLAVLGDDFQTKLVPLRTISSSTQRSINRIQVQWFSDENYREVTKNNILDTTSYSGFYKNASLASDLTGTLSSNSSDYNKDKNQKYGNAFSSKAIVPPALQLTMIQTSEKGFTMENFYTASSSQTNRGTLLLRPTSDTSIKSSHGIDDNNHSNMLPKNSLAYSANKSFNTPIDVYCEPTKPNSGIDNTWGDYACSADFYVPDPIGGSRDMNTAFLVLNMPYDSPQTDVSVKMYHCENDNDPVSSCKALDFANVQPMVDSTGRANDLFRRVEARIELADTSFPIANYALAMTDPSNKKGIQKSFYVTNNCNYSSTYFSDNDVYNLSSETTIFPFIKNTTAGAYSTSGSYTATMKSCSNFGKIGEGGTGE